MQNPHAQRESNDKDMEVQTLRTENNKVVEKVQMTTMQVSMTNLEKVHNTCERLQKILHKRKVTPDMVLSIFYEMNPLDVVLEKLLTEKW